MTRSDGQDDARERRTRCDVTCRSNSETEEGLNGRRAPRDERPFDRARTMDGCGLELPSAGRWNVEFEFLERRMERAQRVTEEAVVGVVLFRCGIGCEVVGTCVVRNHDRAARRIVCPIGMRQRNHARTEAGEQGDDDTGPANPRPLAEHSSQLSDHP
jgi:hypothetical protein